MTIEKTKLIKWKQLSATLKTIKKQEMELRKEIAADTLQGAIGTVTNTYEGYKVKAQQSTRKTVDNEALISLWSDLTEPEKDCVKWVPQIVNADYKQLTEKDMLDSVITLKVNAPTLKIDTI